MVKKANPRFSILSEGGMKVAPTGRKIGWLWPILNSGAGILQAGIFVNTEKVPQIAGTDFIGT